MSGSRFLVTVDLDWACEPAIEETLDALQQRGVPVTVFATHRSPRVEAGLSGLEVGLHPYFDPSSSHGRTVEEVVRHVLAIPHNIPAFRCHRFLVSNESRSALAHAGMRISSNVCADLEVVPPFMDRCGLLEVPIFFEDGGYLFRKRPLIFAADLEAALAIPGTKVLVLHPMHFSVNTPHFEYMAEIKRSTSREDWKQMSRRTLDRHRWSGRGIRDLVLELLDRAPELTTLSALAQARLSRA
jgi:polysaccharide deactylase WbmS-like protein